MILQVQINSPRDVLSLDLCLISTRGTLQIQIRFIRQRSHPTLEQTNNHSIFTYTIYSRMQTIQQLAMSAQVQCIMIFVKVPRSANIPIYDFFLKIAQTSFFEHQVHIPQELDKELQKFLGDEIISILLEEDQESSFEQ